jgi:rare lipoprotein A
VVHIGTLGASRKGIAAAIALMLGAAAASPVDSKTPGAVYCHGPVCHRVLTVAETAGEVGRTVTLKASFYRACQMDRFNPCGLTSSGELFRPERPDNAASPVYPDGTTLLVFNTTNGAALVVRVNNAGPYRGNRRLDLSEAAAERLGIAAQGVAEVQVRVLRAPRRAETLYRRHRSYVPVAGDIGRHASINAAAAAVPGIVAQRLTHPAHPEDAPAPILAALAPAEIPAAPPAIVAPTAAARRIALSGPTPVASNDRDRVSLAPLAAEQEYIDQPPLVIAATDSPTGAAAWIADLAQGARDRARHGVPRDPNALLPLIAARTVAAELARQIDDSVGEIARRARLAARAGVRF